MRALPNTSRHSFLVAADLLAKFLPGCPKDIQQRCAELWLRWNATHSDSNLSRRRICIGGWTRVWAAVCAQKECSPLSETALTVSWELAQTRFNPGRRFYGLSLFVSELGLMTPDVRRAFRNAAVVSRMVTPANVSPEKAAPLRAAEVKKIVEIADPDYGPDVAAVTCMLIIYECMATRAEVTGNEEALRSFRPGVQMRDLDLSRGRARIRFPDIEGGGKERIGRLSEGASAWLRYWISMRGTQEGPLFAAPMAKVSKSRSFARQGGPFDVWGRLQQREGLADRSGIGHGRITVTALKFGRAMALFEAGYSLDYIVRASSWEQTGALITALIKPRQSWSYRRRRESHRLDWPLPRSGTDSVNPVQCVLF